MNARTRNDCLDSINLFRDEIIFYPQVALSVQTGLKDGIE